MSEDEIIIIEVDDVGGDVGTSNWANARTKTDDNGIQWLQLKDKTTGKYRTVFLDNGLFSQGPEES